LQSDSISPWKFNVIASAAESEIAPDSQLGVARPDKDDTMLRVFYQEKSSDGKSASLRETRYDLRFRRWAVQDNPIVSDALPCSRLSAVSDKTNKDVRLYYQGKDLALREIYCHQWRWDGASAIIRKNEKLIERSPISAVSWVSEQLGLQIRVFTVVEAHKNAISQFYHSTGNWWTLPGPAGLHQQHSSLACCRNTAVDTADHNPICVFYQPSHWTIDLETMPAEHDDPISREMAADIHHPTGVPKSRDAGRQRTEKTHPDPPGSEANKSSAQMLAEIASLKKELSSSNAKVDGLRKALDVAQKNLGEAKSKLENISSSPNTPGLDMEDMLGRIRELAAEVEKTRKELGGSPGTM
jgi:hypothetical protein